MAFEDEIDHAEHAALKAQVAEERRSECGQRITITLEWERDALYEMLGDEFAQQVRDTLVRVANLAAEFQTNSIVTSKVEKLGDN